MTGKKTGKAMPEGNKSTSDRQDNPLSHGERHKLIAEAAYYRAERRGFDPGDPITDWLAAEEEIDNNSKTPRTPPRARAKK